jgi:hypothetical protein
MLPVDSAVGAHERPTVLEVVERPFDRVAIIHDGKLRGARRGVVRLVGADHPAKTLD